MLAESIQVIIRLKLLCDSYSGQRKYLNWLVGNWPIAKWRELDGGHNVVQT